MSRARHKGKAMGGVAYDAKGSNVLKEVAKKAGGGAVDCMKIGGRMPKKRMDKRARGGRIGSDKSPMAPGAAMHPFSSAAKG